MTKTPYITDKKDMKHTVYNQNYIVYEDGRVWSNVKNAWLKVSSNISGYKQLTVGKEHWSLHRLLATLFIPNPTGLPQVNHKDSDRHNNSIDNLEWVNNSQNQKHAYSKGRHLTSGAFKMDYYGELHHSSKLKKSDVVEIRLSSLSVKELALQYGVSKQNIRNILNNKIWKEKYL